MADIRLTQYYLSMPNAIKYEGDKSRSAYREAIKKYVPAVVLQRDSKSGNTAIFRASAQARGRRYAALLQLLEGMANNHKINNAIGEKLAKNTNTQLVLIELLRWYEENYKLL